VRQAKAHGRVCQHSHLLPGLGGHQGNWGVFQLRLDGEGLFFLLVPPQGVFLQNCPKVEYGFSGSLEVFCRTACSIFLASLDTCKTEMVPNWKIGVQNGKYGPIGEDLFAPSGMEKDGVTMLGAFDIPSVDWWKTKKPSNQNRTLWRHADATIRTHWGATRSDIRMSTSRAWNGSGA